MRPLSLLLITFLLAPVAATAEGSAVPVAERLEKKRAELEKLRAARDAALVQANIYQLPQHKLEAEAKQKEIDAVEAEIDELEKKK